MYVNLNSDSSGVVMANHQNGIHTATNLVEYPPVYGRNIHPEYKYLIEMPAKDLQKDMAFFGEIPNKNGGNKTDKPKQFKQLTKIDLSSCNNGKGKNYKYIFFSKNLSTENISINNSVPKKSLFFCPTPNISHMSIFLNIYNAD